jgi:hypothetical protein
MPSYVILNFENGGHLENSVYIPLKVFIFVPNLVKNPQTMFWLQSIKFLFYFFKSYNLDLSENAVRWLFLRSLLIFNRVAVGLCFGERRAYVSLSSLTQ